MKVIRADKAGTCMGVDLALNKLDRLIAAGCDSPTVTLGPIIHNPQVVDEYAQKGVSAVSSAESIQAPTRVVIRAHGIPKSIKEGLGNRGIAITDATCPKVQKACRLIEKQAAEGRIILLLGEADHSEVKCLLSYARSGAFVFDSAEAFRLFVCDPKRKYCFAAQTTQNRATFDLIAAELTSRPDCDIKVLQTICDATDLRQQEAIRIARQVDLVVVVGGYNSSNTRRLAEVVTAQGTRALHVETAEELPLAELATYPAIGLTAGASTPRKVIDEIEEILTAL